MNIRIMLITVMLIAAPQVTVANFYKINPHPLVINQCPITQTNNAFDLALLNKGYFVVSQGKKNSELLFTRYGKLLLNAKGYLITAEGDYLLAINKKSDAKHLSKIKIPSKNLPPKATSKASIAMNLSARTDINSSYDTSMTIYDSLANTHVVTNKLVHSGINVWHSKVYVDGIWIGEGSLSFKTTGAFDKQEGFEHLQWPASYGIHDLKIDFSESTQYATPTTMNYVNQNGYTLGQLQTVSIENSGQILLFYSNAQYRYLKNRIAVALFTNPNYLDAVSAYLYRPNDKSGEPRIHWKNVEYAICQGALEEVNCLSGAMS